MLQQIKLIGFDILITFMKFSIDFIPYNPCWSDGSQFNPNQWIGDDGQSPNSIKS